MPGEILTYNLDYLRQCLMTAYTTAIEADGGLAAYIPEGEAATNVEFKWFDDAIGVTMTSGTVDGMVITVPSGDAAGIEVGDYLYQKANGKGFVVASKGAGGALTVTAQDGSSTPLSGKFNVFVPSNVEGSEQRRNIKHQATKKTNYTEIFERGVKMSNSVLACKSEDASSQIASQANYAIFDIKNRVQQQLYSGYPDDGSASEARHFGGLDYFVTNEKADTGTLTYKKICDAIRDLRLKGGRPTVIVCNTVHSDKLNDITLQNQRTQVGETRIGGFSRVFFDPISGQEIKIVYDSNCPEGTIYIGEINTLSFHNLRPLTVAELGKVGDNTALSIIQEVTLSVRNANNAWIKLTGVSFSA